MPACIFQHSNKYREKNFLDILSLRDFHIGLRPSRDLDQCFCPYSAAAREACSAAAGDWVFLSLLYCS
jgi:hypothetical protein